MKSWHDPGRDALVEYRLGLAGCKRMRVNRFGGPWTETKLQVLTEYLEAYQRIFKSNERAKYFWTVYLDAFAGTGYRQDPRAGTDAEDIVELGLADTDEASELRHGSVIRALQIQDPFDEYVFIDSDSRHAPELALRVEACAPRTARVSVTSDDANSAIRAFCEARDWRRQRAVAFLDPYGMQVEWPTIEAIAGTRAIDMWLLVPIGQGVNRLLTRGRLPPQGFANRLTATFGNDDWRHRFYSTSAQQPLFENVPDVQKNAGWDAIAGYVLERLESVFTSVCNEYLLLYNRTNNPMYMLCFAAGNPRGSGPALNIARHLITRMQR